MSNDPRKWVCSQGGPHLLLPFSLAQSWKPFELIKEVPPGSKDILATRYWEVCEIGFRNELAAFPYEGGRGLVIGGETPLSSWFVDPDGRGGDVVIPQDWDEVWTDEELSQNVSAISAAEFTNEPLHIECDEQGLMLIAAMDEAPTWRWTAIPVHVAPGCYAIWSVKKDCGPWLLRVVALVPENESEPA